jgi:hypothetical protein
MLFPVGRSISLILLTMPVVLQTGTSPDGNVLACVSLKLFDVATNRIHCCTLWEPAPVYGNNNNTMVYRISDGTRMMAFYGRALAGDEKLGMIAATNRPQELTVYDVSDGMLLATVMLDENVVVARFVPARSELLVLTAAQHI